MKYLTMIVIFILISLIMSFLKTSSEKKPITEAGMIILRVNKMYAIIAYIAILLVVTLTITELVRTINSQVDLLNILSINFMTLMLSIPLIFYTKNHKIEVTEDIIRYYSIVGKAKEIQWSDIIKVRYGKISLELLLFTDDTKIRLHTHLIGFSSFIETMKQKLEPSLYYNAIIDINRMK